MSDIDPQMWCSNPQISCTFKCRIRISKCWVLKCCVQIPKYRVRISKYRVLKCGVGIPKYRVQTFKCRIRISNIGFQSIVFESPNIGYSNVVTTFKNNTFASACPPIHWTSHKNGNFPNSAVKFWLNALIWDTDWFSKSTFVKI